AWSAFRDFFAQRTRDEAMAALADGDTCASPVLSVQEVADSALMPRATRGVAAGGEKTVRSPVRLPLPEPRAERHGAALLARLGFTDDEIAALASPLKL